MTDGQSVPKGALSVSRADVAHFMLKSLQTSQWDNKAVRIATKKISSYNTAFSTKCTFMLLKKVVSERCLSLILITMNAYDSIDEVS